MRSIIAVAIACGALLPAWSAAVAASLVPVLAATDIAMPADADGAALVLIVKGADAAQLSNDGLVAEVGDIAAAAPPSTVAFGAPLPLPADAGERRWILPFKVSNMPGGATVNRYVTLKIAGEPWTAAYRLISAATAPAWKVSPLPVALRAAGTRWAIPLNIALTRQAAVHALRLAPVELIEENTARALAGGRLALCPSPEPCGGDPIELSPPGGTLWLTSLRVGDAVRPTWPGKYHGTVTVVSLDRPEGETLTIGVSVSAWYWKLAGAALIAAGVAFSYVLTTLLRHRIGRLELMVPAVGLRSAIDRLRQQLVNIRAFLAPREIERKLNAIDAALQDEKLEELGLPSETPRFLQKPGSDSVALLGHIGVQKAWIEVLAVLIDEGMTPLVDLHAAHERRHGTLAGDSPFDEAFNRIDAFAAHGTPPALDQLRAELAAMLEPLRTDLYPVAATGTREAVFGLPLLQRKSLPAPALRDPGELRRNISRENGNGWVFLFLLTVIAGYYLLVLNEPGFGSTRDLFHCLLWGLGLPSGTVAASATVGSLSGTYRAA